MSDWLNKNLKKIIMVGVLVSGYATATNLYFMNSSARDTEVSLQNMDENKVNSRIDLYSESSVYCAGWTIVALISLLIMKDSIKMNNATKAAALIFLSFGHDRFRDGVLAAFHVPQHPATPLVLKRYLGESRG